MDERPIQSFEELAIEMKSEDADRRSHALFQLGKLNDERLPGLLVSALRDKEPQVVRSTISNIISRLYRAQETSELTLFDSEPDCYVPGLLKLLDDEEVYKFAALTLGKIKDERAIEPIIKLCDSFDPRVREWMTWPLGDFRDSRTIEPLVKLLQDTDTRVRFFAAGALGRIDDARVVQPLIHALVDNGRPYPLETESVGVEGVGDIAQMLLVERGIAIINQLVDTFERNGENNLLRARIGVVLIALGDSRAVEVVISTLDQMVAHSIWFWKASVDALVSLNEARAIPHLTLESNNIWVHAYAAQAVKQLRSANET
jgi:HEAT repeat protein